MLGPSLGSRLPAGSALTVSSVSHRGTWRTRPCSSRGCTSSRSTRQQRPRRGASRCSRTPPSPFRRLPCQHGKRSPCTADLPCERSTCRARMANGKRRGQAVGGGGEGGGGGGGG